MNINILISVLIILSIVCLFYYLIKQPIKTNIKITEKKPKKKKKVKQNKNNNEFILYWASWCGHCLHTKPIWFKIKESLNKMLFTMQLTRFLK